MTGRPSLRLELLRWFVTFRCVVADEIDWVRKLSDADNSAAVAQLRGVLLGGLRVALRDRTDVSEAHLEDFAQDALLKVLARIGQFSGRSKFTTWAHAIALNTAFAELRRKRWREVSLESLMADGRELSEPAILSEGAGAADEERARLLVALREAVADKLSDKQRAVIAGALDGLPFDQIVGLLGTNRNAAYKLLHDARRTLKQHLSAAGISTETIRTAFAP
jgi:RNA polymerase sigma-70 factor (ECF subfamily)